jgi:hypothetical protein
MPFIGFDILKTRSGDAIVRAHHAGELQVKGFKTFAKCGEHQLRIQPIAPRHGAAKGEAFSAVFKTGQVLTFGATECEIQVGGEVSRWGMGLRIPVCMYLSGSFQTIFKMRLHRRHRRGSITGVKCGHDGAVFV